MEKKISYQQMVAMLPQSPPMLMVDRVISYIPSASIIAQKCVSSLDPYFAGHFKDDNKVVPGLLIVEGIAQCAFLLAALSRKAAGEAPGENLLISAKSSFRQKVVPGDIITYKVSLDTISLKAASFSGTASVADRVAVRAECAAVRR